MLIKIITKCTALTAAAAMLSVLIPQGISAAADIVYTQYDMTSIYNTGNIYTSRQGAQGNAGYAGAFDYDSFIGDSYNTWQNEWESGMTDNVLTIGDIPFAMRVIDHGDWMVNTPCVWWNTGYNTPYTNFDIEDSYYTSLEILANSDRPTQPQLTVRLNYADGSVEAYNYTLAYFFNGFGDAEDGIESPDCTMDMNGYVGHFSVSVDPLKILESFDIVNDRFNLTSGSDGQPVKNENGQYTANEEAVSNRGRYSHTAAVYAMTLVQDEEQIEQAQNEKIEKEIEEIENAIDSLGEISELTYDRKDEVDRITELLETAEQDGIDAETQISNYSKYLEAVERMNQLYEQQVYTSIIDAIDGLGNIADLTYDQKDDVDNITKLIQEANAAGYTVTEETVPNYSNYLEAVEKINELYAETVYKEIEDAIAALGDVDEITYEDKEKVDHITALIENAQAQGLNISEETVKNYPDYVQAKNTIKGLTSVSITVDMSQMYNQGTIYTSVNQLGSAGYAGSIYYPYFISSEYHDWKKPWSEGMQTNTMTVDGIDFLFKVVDFGDYEDSTSCVFWNTNADSAYTNVDIEDNYYTYVNIMANNDRPINNSKLAVRLNYEDGSEQVYEYGQAYIFNGFGESGSGITVNMINNTGSTAETGYITRYRIPVDQDKRLVSYDILNESYEFVKDDSGNYILDDNGKVQTKASPYSGRDNYTYATAVYSMTLEMLYRDYEVMIEKVINELENELTLRMEVVDNRPVSITDTGKQTYWELDNYIQMLGDYDNVGELENYSMLKEVMPVYDGSGVEVKYDNVIISMDFDKEMKDPEGLVTVTRNGENVQNFITKTEGNSVFVSIQNDFDTDAKYDLRISSNAASIYGDTFTLESDAVFSFTIPQTNIITDFKIVGSDGNEITDMSTYTGSEITVTGELKNVSVSEGQQYLILVCLYNNAGQLIDMDRIYGDLPMGAAADINKTLTTDGNSGCSLIAYSLDDILTMRTIYKTIIK